MRLLKRNTELVKILMDKTIKENDLCIDATLGDGNDSLYMAKLNANVIAFDIQEDAIKSSKKLFDDNNISYDNDKVKFILDSHENIDKYIESDCKVKFATFNLGYLPSGDNNIVTKKESTICAIEKILNHLSKDGVISVICYYDHDGGMDEKIAIDEFFKNLDNNNFEVVKLDKYNDKRNVPISYFVYYK